jgi:trimeric autotransporter adhesin
MTQTDGARAGDANGAFPVLAGLPLLSGPAGGLQSVGQPASFPPMPPVPPVPPSPPAPPTASSPPVPPAPPVGSEPAEPRVEADGNTGAGAAGDAAWSTRFGATNVGSRPEAIAVSGDAVYIGGDFAGPMAGMPEGTYNRIAKWDGIAWQRMGEGLDGIVHAIAVVGQDVYVGGDFSIAGGKAVANHLARWDGSTWFPVAGGVSNSETPSLATVRGLASDGERLYVAGVFDSVGSGAGAVPASGFAALDLAAGEWQSPGGGLGFLGRPGEGRVVAVLAGRVYVGGYFDAAGSVPASSLAALDPGTGDWSGMGDGIRNGEFVGSVDSLAKDEASGTLFIGGTFTSAGPVTTSGVATLTGDSYGTLGAFLRFGDASTAGVFALAFAGGRLYAGGEFTAAGNAAASHWAVHDGTEWSVPGEGVDNVVRGLAEYGDTVVVVGDFQYSGAFRLSYGAIWTGSGWQTFGQGLSYDPYADGNVFTVLGTEAGVVAGGYFDQAGPVPVGSIATWTGSEWLAMGGGLRGVNALAQVYAMATLGGDLYVTGSFATAGAGTAANIARWDGTAWSALGSGLNGTGYALAVLGGRLYVGGRFSAAGTTAANGVAAWDPATSTWSALGNAPAYDDSVLGLAVIGDRHLVIGGKFNAFRAGGRDLVRGLNGLTAFDTQAEVAPDAPLAGYLILAGVQQSSGTGTVRALHVQGGDLYVGGTFDTAGVIQLSDPAELGFSARNVAVWHFATDGRWETPGGTDEPVMALTTIDGTQVVIGGWFGAAGPIAASGVAVYEPATGSWTALGSGVGPGERGVRHVEALAQIDASGLWVGGTFNTAGGAPSCAIALWTATATG